MRSHLSFTHAETHSHYLPKPRNPHADEAERIVRSINEAKVRNPSVGQNIYDTLVDQLIANSMRLAKQPEYVNEPKEWTPPQRCVWRSANHLTHDQRLEVINDRSVANDIKAFAVVNQARWLVPCIFPGCNGSQYASLTDRRFWCVDCCNRPVGGKWLEVIWPSEPSEVERWLSNRPPSAQNWNPGEDGDDIAEQDAAQGVVKSPLSAKEIDLSSWSKETTLRDGSVVPVLHYGTPEWDKAQKEAK